MKPDWSEIGERISIQRKNLGFTQQDIYDKIDVSQNHYSRIENGHVGISIEKLIQLSEILNITTDYILTSKTPNNKNSDFAEKYNKLSIKQKQYINQQIDCLKKFDLK